MLNLDHLLNRYLTEMAEKLQTKPCEPETIQDVVRGLAFLANLLPMRSVLTLYGDPAWFCRVDEMGLEKEISEKLKENNIVYVGELVQKTRPELQAMFAFPRRKTGKILDRIELILERCGMQLGTNLMK